MTPFCLCRNIPLTNNGVFFSVYLVLLLSYTLHDLENTLSAAEFVTAGYIIDKVFDKSLQCKCKILLYLKRKKRKNVDTTSE